ncbi:MAG: response regulator [Rhodothermaceae bacterium]|nr:response regulator [Rhodothermaceae bacterium]
MTGFFHVPSAFGVLEEKVIPALFEGKSSNDSIRVWVAGCATGEEAYSVAILIFQYASTLEAPPKIEIYATDNDKNALEKAKNGVYPKSIEKDMSDFCLSKYFVRDLLGYAVSPEVKGAILFSSHDVLIDNSFQSFDLITCRQLLGYLDQASQSQIITFFHHSLKESGFLFLGDAEFEENLPIQFESVDEEFRIYRLQGEMYAAGTVPQEKAVAKENDTVPEQEVNPTVEIKENEVTKKLIGAQALSEDLSTTQPQEDALSVDAVQSSNTVPLEMTTLDVNPGGHVNGLVKESTLDSIAQIGHNSIAVSLDYKEEKEKEDATESEVLPEDAYYAKLLKEYTPPSLLVDKSFNVHGNSRKTADIITLKTGNLATDFFNKIPDYDRLRLEEGINQVLTLKKDDAKVTVKMLNPGPVGKNLSAEISYFGVYGIHECAHVVFTPIMSSAAGDVSSSEEAYKGGDGQEVVRSDNTKDSSPSIPQGVEIKGQIEDSYLHVVASAPFPILVHAEGGRIIESSPAWYYMAGVKKSEAPTITDWIKKVKGHRITLKDPELKKIYEEKGVVCISIQTTNRDTKLLAFHSYFLGRDSKGRKLTLTMAVDITTYPGHAGMGITPESADYGVAAKKAFLANMSHEVRTPLTSMIGFADYLADNLEGQEGQFARYISESGNRLLETLNAVLRIASVDTLDQVIKYEKLDIVSEVQGVMQLYKPVAEQYDLFLKLVVDGASKVVLDRVSFRRMVANLLGNAVKFTLEGGIEVTVGGNEEAVIVTVEDTGVGIAEEYLPYVFDRFSQESKGLGRFNTGCGLGLSITRELAEALGGGVQVESTQGKGSKFMLRLPAKPADYDEVDVDHEEDDEKATKTEILVVEDNIDTQELILLILQDKYKVSLASSTEEALEITDRQTFDLILMDLNLGGKETGFDLLRELRKKPFYDQVPVLAVSALPIGVIRKQLIQVGFSGYIAKPFTRARIMDAINGILANAES